MSLYLSIGFEITEFFVTEAEKQDGEHLFYTVKIVSVNIVADPEWRFQHPLPITSM
jgi:hypothetical protein